jgi:hypothetical protein
VCVCMCRGSIDLAHTVAAVIQSLASTSQWLSAVQACLSDVLHQYTDTHQVCPIYVN